MHDAQIDDLLRRGIAAAKAGQKDQARELLMEAIELDERNEQAWLWLSGVVESLNDRRICLENVLAINPDNANAKTGLEWLEQHPPIPSPEGDRCPRCQEPIHASEVACSSCALPLIVACPSCGQYADVDQSRCPHCSCPLGDFRQGARYHLDLAHAYLAQRRTERLEEAIAHAEAEAGDDPEVLTSIAALHKQIGRSEHAIAIYEHAIEVAPDDPESYYQMGAIYRQRADHEQANAMFKKAAELANDDPEILCHLAELQLEEEAGVPEALHLLSRAAEITPLSAQIHLLLGDAYLRQGNRKRAESEYNQASKLAPADSAIGQSARTKATKLQAAAALHGDAGRAAVRNRRRLQVGRPGCLTVYVILMAISAVGGILTSIAMAVGIGAGSDMIEEMLRTQPASLPFDLSIFLGFFWVILGVSLVVSTLYLAIAVGLWLLKNWARVAVIVLQTLGLLASLAQVVLSMFGLREAANQMGETMTFPITSVCFLLPAFLVQGYIIFWFVANGELFD
jgi:Flp pilus assembly protein TadD